MYRRGILGNSLNFQHFYRQTKTVNIQTSDSAQIVESEGVTTINIPCDGSTQPDGSNIQVTTFISFQLLTTSCVY